MSEPAGTPGGSQGPGDDEQEDVDWEPPGPAGPAEPRMVSPVRTLAHRRATVRMDKARVVAQLSTAFRTSTAVVITEYRGLTVRQVSALRAALGPGATYVVVKNTLSRLAAVEAGLRNIEALLTGPTAVAFVRDDPGRAARTLRDFARSNPQLVLKGAVLDEERLTADQVRQLAELETRDVLLGRVATALSASLTRTARLLQSPLARMPQLAEALVIRRQGERQR